MSEKIPFKGLFNTKTIIILILSIITFAVFFNTKDNHFSNWDDDYYVTNDPYIKALTPQNLKVIFTEDITKNNYHPFCMLSLAINYYFTQLNPMSYYLTNVFIHILNVILVFLFLLQLCKLMKIEEKGAYFIAALSALWFGIHPMHVESVGWIAERKDVLYTFFYIIALITYLNYVTTLKLKWIWISFFLFIASCLSKPMAVVYPMSLLCIDFLLQRKFSFKLISEKTLFFICSIAFGIMAVYTQNRTGAIAKFETLTIQERIMYAAFGYINYISKFFDPTYLSTFYPYPIRFTTGYLPNIYYAAPIIAIAVTAIPIFIAFKNNKVYFRVAAFGFGYLVANLIFVLQFISVGAAIMADRYSYCAYIGFIFMLVYFIYELIKKIDGSKKQLSTFLISFFKIVLYTFLVSFTVFIGYLCYERTFVWHDAESLLSDAIDKYPYPPTNGTNRIAVLSYKWRGNLYYEDSLKKDWDKALEDYNVVALLRQANASMYDKIGNIYMSKKEFRKADSVFALSLGEQGNVYKTYLDRAFLFCRTGDSINALKNFAMSMKLNQLSEKIFSDTAFNDVQNKQYAAAINEYNLLLTLFASNPHYNFYHGVALFGQNKNQEAIADWQKALRGNSVEVRQSAAYDLCVAYDMQGRDTLAVLYAEMAQGFGYKVAPEFMAKLKEKNKHTK